MIVASVLAGVGAGETPPAMIDCLDLCLRTAECAGDLCNEDKMTTAYTALADQLASQCNTNCTVEPPDISVITATEWQCLFQSSCRQVFGQDACALKATYTCS